LHLCQLQANPEELEILGSGRQKKSYLEVKDCVRAMLQCVEHAGDQINVFDIGSENSMDDRHCGHRGQADEVLRGRVPLHRGL
jgi:nucleoside-diphosphate-sugar epimerase